MLPGSEPMPTACGADAVVFAPHSRNSSLQPLITSGCCVKSGVQLTMPSTLTTRTRGRGCPSARATWPEWPGRSAGPRRRRPARSTSVPIAAGDHRLVALERAVARDVSHVAADDQRLVHAGRLGHGGKFEFNSCRVLRRSSCGSSWNMFVLWFGRRSLGPRMSAQPMSSKLPRSSNAPMPICPRRNVLSTAAMTGSVMSSK